MSSYTLTRRRPQGWHSRAVVRRIEAGSSVYCTRCSDQIKFSARNKANQVICNVYVDGVWDRVEHYHEACYEEAGEPHGEPREDRPRSGRLGDHSR